MDPSLSFWITGIVLGLSAGLSPGPLLTLVISETLRHGTTAGVRVGLAPLISDLPIVAASLFLLSRLPDTSVFTGIVSLVGGAFLLYLAVDGLRFRGAPPATGTDRSRSLSKGVATNFLNPNPYLFWFSIGGPLIVRAAAASWTHAVGFVAGFYLLLVGSKIVLALLVGRSRSFLSSRGYVWTLRVLGLFLLLFAAAFLRDGVVFLLHR
jgi:threonine/homoserine/homoserine lactone efflux protein